MNSATAVPNQTIGQYFADLMAKARQGQIAGARAMMVEDLERELFG